MTLIACIHPNRCRTVFSDVLLSTPERSTKDVTVPTRAYVSPNQLQRMAAQPVATGRKVAAINDKLLLLWAGNYRTAEAVAKFAVGWFGDDEPDPDSAEGFAKEIASRTFQAFEGMLVPLTTQWIYRFGISLGGQSIHLGEYFASGSGAPTFAEFAKRWEAHEPEEAFTPDLTALKIGNDFLAREIWEASPIESGFGGAYEVLVRGKTGFERVNDVMNAFATVTETSGGGLLVEPKPHVMRQWYEGETLCITSLSTPEMTGQGLGHRSFFARSLLDQQVDEYTFVRAMDDLALRPNYLCMFHQIELGNIRVPTSLVMKGTAIDEMIIFTRRGDNLDMEFTQLYRERLSQLVGSIKAGFGR